MKDSARVKDPSEAPANSPLPDSFNQKSETTSERIRNLVSAAFLLAVIVLLSVTPLGFVRIPLLPELTILHVPVIIGSILLGPKYGAFLGLSFGMSSFLNATLAPHVISFAFSPFYSVGDVSGNAWSLIVAFVPRILVGIIPWLVYKGLRAAMKFKGGETISLVISGLAGSLTNTVFVLGFIWLFFAREFAVLMGTAPGLLYKGIMGIVATNGIPEAILASILTVAVCKAVLVTRKRQNK